MTAKKIPPPELVSRIYRNGECDTWEKVAAFLATYGPAHSGAYWRLIETGEIKRPHWRSINTLRAAQDPPLDPLTPGIEYAAESGAQFAVLIDDTPDTALLVDLGGRAPGAVSVKTSDSPLSQISKRPTSRISTLTVRKRRTSRTKISYSVELGAEMQKMRGELGESWEEFGWASFEARQKELADET